VDIARSEFRGEAVALGIEDEERVIADRLEVPVVRRLLLRAVNGAFGTVDGERHASAWRSRRRMLNQVRVQARQALVVPLLGQDRRLEPMQRGCERDPRVSPLPRRQHPKRWVLGQSFSVVRVLIPSQAAIDRLTQQIGQRELAVSPGAGIAEVALNQRPPAEPLIQFPREKQSSIACDSRATELDAKLRVE